MKLPKAIEILDLNLKHANVNMPHDVRDAVKLGIEALKFVQKLKATGQLRGRELLPGETPETNPTRSLHHIKAVLESPLGREPKS